MIEIVKIKSICLALYKLQSTFCIMEQLLNFISKQFCEIKVKFKFLFKLIKLDPKLSELIKNRLL